MTDSKYNQYIQSKFEMTEGPYEMDKSRIEDRVEDNKKGNYALGHHNKNDKIEVEYVGRSDHRNDDGLKSRLIEHLDDDKNYDFFMFEYAKDKKEAYERECRNFHLLKKKLEENGHSCKQIHPRKPDGTNYKCPVSGCDK